MWTEARTQGDGVAVPLLSGQSRGVSRDASRGPGAGSGLRRGTDCRAGLSRGLEHAGIVREVWTWRAKAVALYMR